MEDLRKVLFTDGMSADGLIIITDAPQQAIEGLIEKFIECLEAGKSNYEGLDELRMICLLTRMMKMMKKRRKNNG